VNLSDLIAQEGLVEVASLSAGVWDWTTIAVYAKPDARRFYWLEESGCSCNFFGDADPYVLGDFQDGDREAAIKAVKGLSHYDGDPGRAEVEREAASIRDYKFQA